MGMIKEFKEFAVKGNVVDLAVGVVIGAASQNIIRGFAPLGPCTRPPLGSIVRRGNQP